MFFCLARISLSLSLSRFLSSMCNQAFFLLIRFLYSQWMQFILSFLVEKMKLLSYSCYHINKILRGIKAFVNACRVIQIRNGKLFINFFTLSFKSLNIIIYERSWSERAEKLSFVNPWFHWKNQLRSEGRVRPYKCVWSIIVRIKHEW